MKPYRTFLCPPDSHANHSFVLAEQCTFSLGKEFNLSIGDCNRTVTLNFSADRKGNAKKALTKLAKIQKAIDHIREGLEGDT